MANLYTAKELRDLLNLLEEENLARFALFDVTFSIDVAKRRFEDRCRKAQEPKAPELPAVGHEYFNAAVDRLK